MDPTTIAQTLAAYAQPARPPTLTPPSAQDFSDYLYGRPPSSLDPAANLPGPMEPPPPRPPLPAWLPQNVQSYINQAPSYSEGERQSPLPGDIAGGEPYSLTPQIGDIQRLFQKRITQNAPTSDLPAIRSQQFQALMKLPGFSGFTGGDEI